MVVELDIYSAVEKFFKIPLRHINRFNVTEFERKVVIQNHQFG